MVRGCRISLSQGIRRMTTLACTVAKRQKIEGAWTSTFKIVSRWEDQPLVLRAKERIWWQSIHLMVDKRRAEAIREAAVTQFHQGVGIIKYRLCTPMSMSKARLNRAHWSKAAMDSQGHLKTTSVESSRACSTERRTLAWSLSSSKDLTRAPWRSTIP